VEREVRSSHDLYVLTDKWYLPPACVGTGYDMLASDSPPAGVTYAIHDADDEHYFVEDDIEDKTSARR
jgi:hypothetical protein